MPLSAYQRALADLTDHARQAVEEVFTAGLTGSTHCQVSRNIADETAFSTADFTSLLEMFAMQLASGDLPRSAWRTACRAHKRKGRVIPAADCPATLGRAKGLEHHAAAIARASHGDLTKEQAKKLLLKYSVRSTLVGSKPFYGKRSWAIIWSGPLLTRLMPRRIRLIGCPEHSMAFARRSVWGLIRRATLWSSSPGVMPIPVRRRCIVRLWPMPRIIHTIDRDPRPMPLGTD